MNTIKKLMKNVSAAAIAVMLIGGVFAFASQSEYLEHNTYFDPDTELWEELPAGMELGTDYTCEASPTDECTGFREDPNSQEPIDVKLGTFTQ